MENMDRDIIASKRLIDKHDDYAIPRLEKQLRQVDGNMRNLQIKRNATGSF